MSVDLDAEFLAELRGLVQDLARPKLVPLPSYAGDDVCVACAGKRTTSRGMRCVPCGGSGKMSREAYLERLLLACAPFAPQDLRDKITRVLERAVHD